VLDHVTTWSAKHPAPVGSENQMLNILVSTVDESSKMVKGLSFQWYMVKEKSDNGI